MKILVEHQLGPLWIPAGSSASMPLKPHQKYAFQCSFVPTKIFGLDVAEPTDWGYTLVGYIRRRCSPGNALCSL